MRACIQQQKLICDGREFSILATEREGQWRAEVIPSLLVVVPGLLFKLSQAKNCTELTLS